MAFEQHLACLRETSQTDHKAITTATLKLFREQFEKRTQLELWRSVVTFINQEKKSFKLSRGRITASVIANSLNRVREGVREFVEQSLRRLLLGVVAELDTKRFHSAHKVPHVLKECSCSLGP